MYRVRHLRQIRKASQSFLWEPNETVGRAIVIEESSSDHSETINGQCKRAHGVRHIECFDIAVPYSDQTREARHRCRYNIP